MNDTLKSPLGEKKIPSKNSEIILTATAKPPKEKSRPDLDVVQSINSIVDGLQSSGTIQSSSVNEITKRLEKITDPQVKSKLALLKKEMDALELQEVADALATIDSPWGTLTQEIAQSDRLKRSLPDTKNREQYVDKLLFPLGAQIYRDIRSMTTDPLTRQLMFHSIADDIRAHPERIRKAQSSIPLPKDTGTIKQAMLGAASALLGTHVDTPYKKNIHVTVLKSRLSAEQPLFDLAQTEIALEKAKQEVNRTVLPFAKEEASQTLREIQQEQREMKRIRKIIDQELPHVRDEQSLMKALDTVQHTRFEGADVLAPYKLEPWVPENIRQDARKTLEMLSKPKEDLYTKALKQLDALERQFRSQKTTWSEAKYKDHMKWLADPASQTQRKQKIINIIDLVLTLTTLVYGTTGGIQRQIEGSHSGGMTAADAIDYVESRQPWEVAADLATPKLKNAMPGKRLTEM